MSQDQQSHEQGIRQAIEVMEKLSENGAGLDTLSADLREALMRAAGRLSRPNRNEIRARNRKIHLQRKAIVDQADRKAKAVTGIREARTQAVFTAPEKLVLPPPSEAAEETHLKKSQACYVCKTEYTKLHHFYDSMCPSCADFNYQKRFQTTSLHGQVALITGARMKIGYHAALMMLRAGAHVVVTTRFPVDAASRFSKEKDFGDWRDRLDIHGLDLRHIPSVELFTSYFEQKYTRLDILINNAAQTVRRPPGFYAHMMNLELAPSSELSPDVRQLLSSHDALKEKLNLTPATRDGSLPTTWHGQEPGVGLRASAKLSQIPYSFDNSLSVAEVFPEGKLDADLQQVDLREMNSWRLGLADVPTPELLEVQLVNSIAPFVLCSRLTPLMRKNPTGQKHIVNVSAMEGKFSRYTKTDKHPHTNMAKAALNMFTYTSARDLVNDGIYMNAVDTGWVTDEDPAALSQRKKDRHDFQPPLDIVDGAARICDPFFHGILSGQHWCGKFLKDYVPTEW